MTNSTLFVDYSATTPIRAAWLNDVNGVVYAQQLPSGVTQAQMQAMLGVNSLNNSTLVVNNITALRSTPHTGSTEVFISGYSTSGDGGSGNYYYNPSDTTSADNGWSIIVSSDGSRWYRRNSVAQTVTTSTDVYTQHVARTTSHTGGTPGTTNSALRVDHNVGAGVTDYEWAFTSVMNNSATAGENVAVYGQGNRQASGVGPTWAGVMEAREVVAQNDPTSGLIGLEVDNRSNGTDANNNRIGIDVVCARYNTSGAATQVSFGVRVQNNADSNVLVKTAFSASTTCNVAFDASASTVNQAAFKMAQNQSIAFDALAVNQMSYDGTGVALKVSGALKSRLRADGGIDLNTGVTSLSGTFSTGSAAPTLTANKPGVSSAIAVWLSVVINGTQYWIPAWNN